MELAVVPASSGVSLRSVGGEGKPKSLSVPVATQTAPVGVIVPPPDIRTVLDKTAQFVARNGYEFEKRILANEKNNAKFNFLMPGDPYHAYYEQKVASFRSEDGEAKPPQVSKATEVAEPGTAKVALQLRTHFRPIVLETPDAEKFTLHLPEGITAFDLDVIKLTAQFVARNGKSFLTGLTSREHTNAQFNFLKPTHSMFTFFTSLADAYSKILMPQKLLSERLRRDADKAVVLDRCLKRLEWERSQERARREEQEKEEAEREAMAAVDWHDFVVVETIDFYDDEDASLPAPMPLAEVISQLRAARVEEPTSAQADAAMDVEMDEEERELVQPSLTVLPPPPPPLPPPDAPEPQMKIVRNYKRTDAAPALAAANAPQLVVSPITGELVPVDQMAEHMRISLIDPKWKVEREAMLGKLRGSTIASDEEIAKNVVGLARTRPDIFGSAEDMSVAVSAEMEKHRRAEERAPGAAARPPMQPEPPRAPMLLPPLAMQWPPAMPPPGYPMQGAMPPGYPPGYPGLPPPGYAMPSMPPIGMYGLPPPHFPGPQYGIPMQGGVQPPAITPAEEPDLKRQRTEDVQVSEEDFAEAHPEPVSVEVAVPEVEGDATLRGQTVKLIVGVMETIGDVKARLAAAIGIPASKQKIMHRGTFLKDTSTLAAYNFGTGTSLIMGIKSRGKK